MVSGGVAVGKAIYIYICTTPYQKWKSRQLVLALLRMVIYTSPRHVQPFVTEQLHKSHLAACFHRATLIASGLMSHKYCFSACLQ